MQWPFGAGRSLVTVFSASNYSGKMQNQGAYALLGSASDASDATAASTCVYACEELRDGSFGYPFGRLRFMQYETRQVSETRARIQTLGQRHGQRVSTVASSDECSTSSFC